jgi:uncharacterized integral membrane protein
MFRKVLTIVVAVPLAAIIIAFAVANRQSVTVSFDPFSSADPAYAATLPLFAVVMLVLIFGVVVGGVAAWIRQGKWRRAARQLDAENRNLRSDLDDARRRAAAVTEPASSATMPATTYFDPAARAAISPPVP